MLPYAQVGPVTIPTYGLLVALGMVVAWSVRKREVARLGYARSPGHEWVGVGALLGAVVGSKLGMFLFDADPAALARELYTFEFTGKTVVGGIGGGYLGVEVAKRLAGVHHSTGDSFAVALPLGQAFGRVGCFLHGCCGGVASAAPWAIPGAEGPVHPVQLYEAGLDLALAGLLWTSRTGPAPAGSLFRRYLVGYALVRFGLEPLRADAVARWGPLTPVQWVCLATIAGFTLADARARRVIGAA